MIYQIRDDIERLSKDELKTLLDYLQKVLTTESKSYTEKEHIKYDIYRIQNKLNGNKTT
jgi:hypothetical protein